LKDEKHGPYLYVSVFDGKQSRQVYVPRLMRVEVRRWVNNAQRLAAAVGTLSALNMELIRRRQVPVADTSRNRPAAQSERRVTR
jgi:hypothetical protein